MTDFRSAEPYRRIANRLLSLPPRAEWAIVAAWTLVLALVMLAVLVLPGRTYIGIYSHDIMIFFDGAHRILAGQVSSRDFHMPFGPLAYIIPAVGLWLSGSLGGMFPAATAVFTLLSLPAVVYVSASRLKLPYALGFSLFILILLIAPLNPGEPVDAVTFAMYYNRFCWAFLGLCFLLCLPARGAERPWADAIVLAAMLLVMLYLKITYAVVGIAFTCAFLLLPKARRGAFGALAIVAVSAVVIELFWGETRTYLADLQMAAQASGAVRGSLFTLARVVLQNFQSCILIAAVIAIALFRGARFEYLILAVLMAASGVVIINQNAQAYEILTFLPAGLVAALAPRRNSVPQSAWADYASNILLVAIAVPFMVTASVALAYHGVKAARGAQFDPKAELDGLVVADRTPPAAVMPIEDVDRMLSRGSADLHQINLLGVAGLPEGDRGYFWSIHDGLRILRSNPALSGKVRVFDVANPFDALLGRESPKGGDVMTSAGRTVSATVYRPATEMLGDVDVVMVPKRPRNIVTTDLLWSIYGPYVRSHYRLVARTTYWDAWARADNQRR